MVIEIMTFRLSSGIDDAVFLAADREVQSDFAYRQAGLLRRTTARGEGGEWIVVDLWHSPEEADRCAGRWGNDPVTAEFISLLDENSVRTQRYTTLD